MTEREHDIVPGGSLPAPEECRIAVEAVSVWDVRHPSRATPVAVCHSVRAAGSNDRMAEAARRFGPRRHARAAK